MSTFFRSAAMALLSRTLQTLLSKYLSDVDVEGVNLPSIYSSDGQSGWGVRLSNVKLREGAKLMDLPGKRRRKRKIQKRKKEATAAAESKDTAGKYPSSSRPTNRKQEPHEVQDPSMEEPPKTNGSETWEEQTAQTSTESDMDTIASQSTTVKSTYSKSWFYWGSRYKTESAPAVVPEEEAPVREGTSENYGKKTADRVIEPPGKSSHAASNGDEGELSGERTGGQVVDSKGEESDSNFLDDEDIDDDDEFEDEEYTDELPMVLRLGEGGTIGILDVRLVNKSIHVLVEDAFLTVEAVQLEPDDREDRNDKDGKPPEKSKPQKKVLDPQSVGDRILAENAIARALSALPNLFLRDIQVRFVVRDEVVRAASEEEEESVPKTQQPATDSRNDIVVDFGIEFLSVTDGEDFMANFRGEDGDSSDGDDTDGEDEAVQPQAFSSFESPFNQNEFFTKRVRTGRGPEGGIVLRIYPPGEFGNDIQYTNSGPVWARQTWLSSSQYCALRLSGFDLVARIYLGTKREVEVENGGWYVDEYDEYTVNSMLFGVDYIAPGPKPPLPPMPRRGASTVMDGEEIFWDHPGATTYQVDDNGIQSSTLESSFYRIARGLTPTLCDRDHLPCEWCSRCWAAEAPGIAKTHELDSATPMPGLVLSISARDPIEVNIDRPSLEVIGLIASLFVKTKADLAEEDINTVMPSEPTDMDANENLAATGASRSSHLLIHARQTSEGEDDATNRNATSQSSLLGVLKKDPVPEGGEEEDSEDSFPVYMQPEKIQVLGLNVSEVRVRIHVMSTDKGYDHGLAFCYWEVLAKCVTVDQQKLTAPERPFQDTRLDVGFFKAIEYKGVERKQLISLGMKQRVVDFDEMTVETLMTREGNNQRSPWPSTAAALLEVQPPLETLVYEARDGHGVQLRYITVTDHGVDTDTIRSHANIRVGVASVDVPYAIRTQIRTIFTEAREAMLGPRLETETISPTETANAVESLTEYKFQIDGGHIRLDPFIDIRLPQTKFAGQRSSDNGLLFETLLERVNLRYGKRAPVNNVISRGLSLEQLAELSENVRLRILLFLKDLKPLETALGVKPEANSFLRCRAVNKGIVKMAKKIGKSHHSRMTGRDCERRPTNRRQELMAELLGMDEDSLEELWGIYTRSQRIAAKRRANTSQF